MKTTKDWKYYLRIFLISTVGLLVYVIYMSIKNGEFEFSLYGELFYVPLFFAFFTYLIDKVMKIATKGIRKKGNLFDDFTLKTSLAMKDTDLFDIEDYRKLRENLKFQKALNHAFQIVEEGETEDITYEYLTKKFKKDTMEYNALMIVIKESKKMQDLS